MARKSPRTPYVGLDFTALVGRRVCNRGDICNAPRVGIVSELRTDRWGTFAVIRWDEADTIGWERGQAVTWTEAESVIAAYSIGAGRFTFITEG